MIGPEPTVDRGVGLLGEIADRHANRDPASRRDIREEHRERVDSGHATWLMQLGRVNNGLDATGRAEQPIDEAGTCLDQGLRSSSQDVAGKEMTGQFQSVPYLSPGW